jgi:pyruvate/2-oxoglutarate dehydrogenase complex dihydrolipoamide dehydrogenase (E3) component
MAVAPERFEILVLGSGAGGKLLACHMAQSGRRTALVERQWIGGSCPNVNCMPSKKGDAGAGDRRTTRLHEGARRRE